MANVNMDKVVFKFNEDSLWDDIYMQNADDGDGDNYCIFDDWDSVSKFVEYVIAILELDKDTKDYDIEKILETDFVFSDEYTTCTECGNVIRTSPDSYSWQPSFHIGDDYIVCLSCFSNNVDYKVDYLEDKINNYQKANQLLEEQELDNLGFKRISEHEASEHESGFRDVTNMPESLYEALKSDYKEILFSIDSVGQFQTYYSVWVR